MSVTQQHGVRLLVLPLRDQLLQLSLPALLPPPAQLQLDQPDHPVPTVLDGLRGPHALLADLLLGEGEAEATDEPLADAFEEVEGEGGRGEGDVELRPQQLLERVELRLLAPPPALQLDREQRLPPEPLQRLAPHKPEHQPRVQPLLAQLEVHLRRLVVVERRVLVELRVVLEGLVADAGSGQFLQRLALEVELGLGVDDLVDELEVGEVEEVGVGLVARRDGEDAAVELALDDGAHVVVGAAVALELGQLAPLELLLQTRVVHLVRPLQQPLHLPPLPLQAPLQPAPPALHRLQLTDVLLVLQPTALHVARLSSIEHSRYYTQTKDKISNER